MKKTTEEGGASCGICSVSLQQASIGFGITDVTHGIVGVAVLMSMILKQENDRLHEQERLNSDKATGYAKFVQKCPLWVLYMILGSFILQITLGMMLCLGASNRSSGLCGMWAVVSFLACPVTPITYCLLGLGRVYEWVAVWEWVCKMDKEELEFKNEISGRKEKDFFVVSDYVGGEDDDEDAIEEVGFEK